MVIRILLLFLALCGHRGVTCFAPAVVVVVGPTGMARPITKSWVPSSSSSLHQAMNEDSLPETSFGAEVVPEGQRPVNEYLDLLRAPLFGWASQDTGTTGLLLRLVGVYVVSFGLICYPIAGATFTQEEYVLQKVAAANLGSIALCGLVMVRLYTGWSYVGSRLQSKVIDYEETGWYDGDKEPKGEAERQRDLFLYKANVKPVEDRLKLVGTAILTLLLASAVAMNVANNAHPLFDEYNPDMLEQLKYDDDLAQYAAQKAAGKPAYCDSRYYRAVANGGQGCD